MSNRQGKKQVFPSQSMNTFPVRLLTNVALNMSISKAWSTVLTKENMEDNYSDTHVHLLRTIQL